MPDRISFTRPAVARIANVVRTVENARKPGAGLRARAVVEKTGKTFRMCTFTGEWAIDSVKTVTFKNQTNTPNTVSVTNLVCGLGPGGTCDASIAKDGTAWFLIQPNLTQQPGYSASGTQVLTIQSGKLYWLGTTACT